MKIGQKENYFYILHRIQQYAMILTTLTDFVRMSVLNNMLLDMLTRSKWTPKQTFKVHGWVCLNTTLEQNPVEQTPKSGTHKAPSVVAEYAAAMMVSLKLQWTMVYNNMFTILTQLTNAIIFKTKYFMSNPFKVKSTALKSLMITGQRYITTSSIILTINPQVSKLP